MVKLVSFSNLKKSSMYKNNYNVVFIAKAREKYRASLSSSAQWTDHNGRGCFGLRSAVILEHLPTHHNI